MGARASERCAERRTRRSVNEGVKNVKSGVDNWSLCSVGHILTSFPRSNRSGEGIQRGGPAPRHDISGTWTPARGDGDVIQGQRAKHMPEDAKPEHQLPYTPLTLETLQ